MSGKPQEGLQPGTSPGGYPTQAAYPPPGEAPPPQYAQTGGAQTVIINQPTRVIRVDDFGPSPVPVTCSHCQASIVTGVHYTTGTMTWVACGIIALVGLGFGGLCCLGCCLIPFCIDSCKDIVHTCPNCGQVVAHNNRM